jgi:glycerol-3-phosphate dehydrogenase (NAD(P)+)
METKLTNKQKLKIVVVGSGSFGTALGTMAARSGHDVCIICRNKDVIDEINNQHTNKKYFPNEEIKLPKNLRAANGFEEVKDCNMIIHAIPVQVSIDFMKKIIEYLPDNIPYIIASKGILLKERKFFSEIWDEIFPKEKNIKHIILSGPSFAIEIMKEYPTCVVAACKEIAIAEKVQESLSNESFRIYVTDDVVGVEVGGAIKNVIAICAGLLEGLGFKYNTLSALVTRGVFELSKFCEFIGGKKETLNGLAGIGDVMLSCFGGLSRNKKVGLSLAKGESIQDIIKKDIEVAEGVPTMQVLNSIIIENNLNMPICKCIYRYAYENLSQDDAKKTLMLRALVKEEERRIIDN